MAAELSNLGQSAPSQSTNVGQPGGALGGKDVLSQALEDSPTLGGAVTTRGAIGGLIGTALAGLLGGARGAASFAGGIMQGFQQNLNEDLKEQADQVKLGNLLLEEENKQANRLTQLMVGNFAALEFVDPAALSKRLMLGDTGIVVNPGTTLAKKRSLAAAQARTEMLMSGLKETESSEGKAFFAQAAFNTAGIPLSDEVINSFAEQGGKFSKQEIFDNFSNWEDIFQEMQNNGGEFPFNMAKERPEEDSGSWSASKTAFILMDRVAARLKKENDAIDDPAKHINFDDAMLLELHEGERLFVRDEIKGLNSAFTDKDYARMYQQTFMSLGMLGLLDKDLLTGDFDENMLRNFNAMARDASTVATQKADSAKQTLVDKFAREYEKELIEAGTDPTALGLDAFNKEVDRRVNAALTSSGRTQRGDN